MLLFYSPDPDCLCNFLFKPRVDIFNYLNYDERKMQYIIYHMFRFAKAISIYNFLTVINDYENLCLQKI